MSSSNIANNIKAEAVHVSMLVALRNDISKLFKPSMEPKSKANAMPFIQAALLYSRGSIENISNNPPVNNIIANAMQIYILVNTDSIAIMVKRAKNNLIGLSFRASANSSANFIITPPKITNSNRMVL
ncbi:hypothetical protein KAS31_04015 [Candidatus Parcubacteria bacterium]|nr:hypothetical protein [Candidatus Parcubacteria bacterium]